MAKLIEAGAPAGLVSSFAEAGAAKPDISTAEAFKQALLQAKMIGHSSNGAGLYNTRLFQKLGIYEQIKDKITIINGRPVAAAVAAGDVEIGIQQTKCDPAHGRNALSGAAAGRIDRIWPVCRGAIDRLEGT